MQQQLAGAAGASASAWPAQAAKVEAETQRGDGGGRAASSGRGNSLFGRSFLVARESCIIRSHADHCSGWLTFNSAVIVLHHALALLL